MQTKDTLAIKQPSKLVAIVVPLSNRTYLTADEEISLRHLRHFLGKYDKYLVIPKSLEVNYPDFGLKRFDKRYFGSNFNHGRLLLTQEFYKEFSDYKYILLYHLDALVFSDQLTEWCETDLDYIAAPWFQCEDAPWVKTPQVGGGGLSLRKVASYLQVLNSTRRAIEPNEFWNKYFTEASLPVQLLNLPRKYLKYIKYFNSIRWEIYRSRLFEDRLIALKAQKYYPDFKIASVEAGLRFAFEVAPRLCFEKNNYQLPFGCHAWDRYDREFWEPYLLR